MSTFAVHRPDITERGEFIRDFAALRIKGAQIASTGVLRNAMMHTPRNECFLEDVRSTKKNLAFFVNDGGAEPLVFRADRYARYKPCALSRLLPVPGELGFLSFSSAKKHCGTRLTKGTVDAFRTDSKKHLLYVQSVKQFMDDFSIPSSARNPVDARAELLKLVEEVEGYGKYDVCRILYRLLASTYFLDPQSYTAISRVFTEDVAREITKKFPKQTHGLNTAVNYMAFISSLQELEKFYGTISQEDLEPDQEAIDSELRHTLASEAAHSIISNGEKRHVRRHVSVETTTDGNSRNSSRSSYSSNGTSSTRSNSPDIISRNPKDVPVIFTFPHTI